MDSDSDVDDILNNLLANDDDVPIKDKFAEQVHKGAANEDFRVRDKFAETVLNKVAELEKASKTETTQKVLKELDYNFLDKDEETPPTSTAALTPNRDLSSLIGDVSDSSDEEDKKYFEEQRYSESGRSIKELLKQQSLHKNSSPPKLRIAQKSISLISKAEAKKDESVKEKPKTALTTWLNKPSDVYSDPVFGLRIVKPLISSTELRERMKDRKAVTVSRVKGFLATQDQSQDWVIAGVLIHRSTTKKSQNGNQYCIWQISDLSDSIPTVAIFLFSGAYKSFWKTSEGTVVGILNPNVMESRNDKGEATLSVDNSQKIMILGNSKDMGKCKAVKKSGDPCTNIVNKHVCEYCIYHVKQEYHKASRRADLQTDKSNRTLGAFGKNQSLRPNVPSQGNGLNQLNMLAVPAKRNLKMEQKDSERLALLTGQISNSAKSKSEAETNSSLEKFNKNRGWSATRSALSLSSISSISNSPKSQVKPNVSQSQQKVQPKTPTFSVPRLGSGVSGDVIDFSEPITKRHVSAAKMNAIKWAKQKGGIKQSSNVNKIRESKEKLEASSKRKREEEKSENLEKQEAKKTCSKSDKFKELMEATSAHADLIEQSDDNEREKYFNKLEAKERMEEKMMTTYKVDCKAVKCLICRYTSFSASDICKEKRHPLRVIDGVKSFFKCADCGNRTVSLDKLPSHSCQKCSGSRWLRAAMMDEKRTNLTDSFLSIRGGEEKFVGSDVKNTSINLLVPDDS